MGNIFPEWWDKEKYEKMCRAELMDQIAEKIVLPGQCLEKVDGYKYAVLGKIEYVYDSATIKSVSDSATIKSVSGSATIESVSGSATIKSVSGSATIKEIKGKSTITNAQIPLPAPTENAVIIDRSGDRPKIIVANKVKGEK
jgi:hypothetical protein